MDKVTEQNQRVALRALAAKGGEHLTFFKALAGRERDASETTAERIMQMINSNRPTATDLMKDIAEAGVADLYWGRRGAKTRLVWKYSCKSVGEAALEPNAALKIPQIGEDDSEAALQIGQKSPISRAKELLVKELGVREENIEIIIRG